MTLKLFLFVIQKPWHCGYLNTLPPPFTHNMGENKMVSASEEVKLRWDLSTDEILKKTEELIERSKKVYDAIGALKPHQLTFNNCLKVCLLLS